MVVTSDERREHFEIASEAMSILSNAKRAALYLALDEVHSRSRAFEAIETYRWVANAYDHVERAQRVLMGLDLRGDPALPDWRLP
jgi:hypothetical protein